MKILLIIYLLIFSHIALACNMLDFLNFPKMSVKGLSENHIVRNPIFVETKEELSNSLITLSHERVNKINNLIFNKKNVLTDITKILVFSYPIGDFKLYLGLFSIGKDSFYTIITPDMINKVITDKKEFIEAFTAINASPKYIMENVQNIAHISINFEMMKYNKETEILSMGFIDEYAFEGRNIFTRIYQNQKAIEENQEILFKMAKRKEYFENFKPSYRPNMEDNEELHMDKNSFTTNLSVEKWKEEFVTKYEIPKIEEKRKVKIALIDAGFYREELIEQVFANTSDVELDHGTHVGGIILGVNSNVEILSYNVYEKEKMKTEKIAKAINDAIENNVSIINLSISGIGASEIEYNAIKLAQIKGIVVVIAAGNDGIKLSHNKCNTFPVCYKKTLKNIISVGNAQDNEKRNNSSNYGEMVDIFHKGTHVQSFAGKKGFIQMTGTSMATPFVTGLISQFIGSRDTQPSIQEVRDFLKDHTKSVNDESSDVYMNVWINNQPKVIATNP